MLRRSTRRTRGTLQEVVVTAQRREENLQDVPISVAALSGDQLKQAGVTAIDQLGATVPGVDIFQFGQQATTTITVRGVSQNDFADQNEAPVAVYEDGAYNSFIGGAGVNLFDINRVEVLRGPQGTLFGRNATGGLVQIISNQPTDDFEAYGTADAGSFGLARFEGALSGPLGAGITSRLSVSATRQDGYDDNTSGPRIGGARNLSTRLQFAFKPTDSVDVLLKLHSVRDDVTGVAGYKTSPSEFFPNVDNGLVHAPPNFQDYQKFCQGFFGVTPAPGAQDCFGVVNSDPANPWQVSVNTPGIMARTQYGATATDHLAPGAQHRPGLHLGLLAPASRLSRGHRRYSGAAVQLLLQHGQLAGHTRASPDREDGESHLAHRGLPARHPARHPRWHQRQHGVLADHRLLHGKHRAAGDQFGVRF